MFRFFRKHMWLLAVVIILTILSFVMFMGSAPTRGRQGRGGASDGNYGTYNGRVISNEEFAEAVHDYMIMFFLGNGEWPEKDKNVTAMQIDQNAYANILLNDKAQAMGVSVSDKTVAEAASEMLASPGLNRAMRTSGRAMPMDEFVKQVLTPVRLTSADFEHAVRTQLVKEQLQLSLGLAGALVTPQEAGMLYDREFESVSADAVFFEGEDYLSKVSLTPAQIGQFYTNYMSYYRTPDRLQVNYVWFNLTNFVTQSKAEWAKTNLEESVEAAYRQVSPNQFPDAKTPEEVKAKIRDFLIQRRAFGDASVPAREFVATLFAMTPVTPENFAVVAKQKGLDVHLSEPFSEDSVGEVFPNAPDVGRAAFGLNADTPYSEAIAGADGIYIVSVAKQIPASVPPFDTIKDRVKHDCEMQMAIAMAREAGTNFYFSAMIQVAAGKTFADAAKAGHEQLVEIPPFSLSSTNIAGIGERADIGTMKEVAFGTPVGNVSPFTVTSHGGLVLFPKFITPPDPVTKASRLAGYESQLRRGRENEAFNMWLGAEANRAFRNITLNREAGAPRQQ
jgi:hypothetical protein